MTHLVSPSSLTFMPPAGIEPTSYGLEGRCLVHSATGAYPPGIQGISAESLTRRGYWARYLAIRQTHQSTIRPRLRPMRLLRTEGLDMMRCGSAWVIPRFVRDTPHPQGSQAPL